MSQIRVKIGRAGDQEERAFLKKIVEKRAEEDEEGKEKVMVSTVGYSIRVMKARNLKMKVMRPDWLVDAYYLNRLD